MLAAVAAAVQAALMLLMAAPAEAATPSAGD
jgi:hypothetical protein